MMEKDKIKVCKSGAILGINRYTEIPLAALELADSNMMFPEEAEEKEFKVKLSEK